MTIRMLVLGVALTGMTVAGKEPVSIRVFPAVSFAPADLVIQTRIEPDDNNRAMEVAANSEEFYRSSTIPLDGGRAPQTITIRFVSLPPGVYEVNAALIGADGRRRALAPYAD